MRLAVTGFVSVDSGSVSSANALLLPRIVDAGLDVDFFSKPSFVDPRPVVGSRPRFRFVPVSNRLSDALRRGVEGQPFVGFIAGRLDAVRYNHLLVRRMRAEHRSRRYDLALWMGDYAHGAVPGIPTVSFAQGPPGTDARSVLRRRAEIRALAGGRVARRLETLARLRLSPVGLPPFRHSDHIIVGSRQSRRTLAERYGVPPESVSSLPYPIDLDLFSPARPEPCPARRRGPLSVLWLGRIVPRKRLDLFLDGAATAIARGVDLELTVVGRSGLVPGYERLIAEFRYPERVTWSAGVSRAEVPSLLRRHDVLVQPSEEEDFGSSVAEAQACGLPVVVGRTNGNADYLCARDVHLSDDRPETLASALEGLFRRRATAAWGDAAESRRHAERCFDARDIAARLVEILEAVLRDGGRGASTGHGAR